MFVRHAPTRKRPQVGDVIGMEIEGRGWVLGRVVVTDAVETFFPGFKRNKIVLYVYRYVMPEPRIPERMPGEDLLLPPYIVDRELWTRGYAVLLGNREFLEGERFATHSFGSEDTFLMDEHGTIVREPTAMIGEAGLWTAWGVFRSTCKALFSPA